MSPFTPPFLVEGGQAVARRLAAKPRSTVSLVNGSVTHVQDRAADSCGLSSDLAAARWRSCAVLVVLAAHNARVKDHPGVSVISFDARGF
jgi:hypothetical protein